MSLSSLYKKLKLKLQFRFDKKLLKLLFGLSYPFAFGHFGVDFEYFRFTKQKGGYLGETDIVPHQEFTQVGIVYKKNFDDFEQAAPSSE